MKIGDDKLRMSSGEVRKFRSETARDNYERVAEAVKHGWKPTDELHHALNKAGKHHKDRKGKG